MEYKPCQYYRLNDGCFILGKIGKLFNKLLFKERKWNELFSHNHLVLL